MFIIKDGYAYTIRDNKAYKLDFDENGKLFELKNDEDYVVEDIGGYDKYTYREISAKLNIKYYSNLKREEIERAEAEKAEKKAQNKRSKEKEDLEQDEDEE